MLSHLHPTARLLVWVMLAVALQFLPVPVLLVGLLVLPLAGGLLRAHWRKLLRRSRFLLLSLFLVLAYGLPGEELWGQAWLPSREGLADSGVHVLRLVVLLGTLAWLLAPLGHQALMGGVWRLLRPLARLGIPTDRTVVRLSLVLEYVESPGGASNWRQWLDPRPQPGELAPVLVSLPPWRWQDGALLGGAALLLTGCLAWPG